MASLTESYQMSELIMEKSKNPPNNNWFDSVYLCIQNSESSHPLIDGFKCYKFNKFNEADNYYNNNKSKIMKEDKYHRHTMIPVCKWVPYRFHRFVINYNLQKIFWRNNITLLFKKN